MNAPDTIRERIHRAASSFKVLEAAVLTTFNLSASFLEDHALPAALGIDAETAGARSAELHQRLAQTACTVFYDPYVTPQLSGRYRYVARPVPVRGRFFHPKLVILAGTGVDDVRWVYVAVSSANLTLSGWGRNAESFGETWIHTRRQQPWAALNEFLAWMQAHAALGESPDGNDAVARVRATLNDMTRRNRFADYGDMFWTGTLRAQLYTSVVHVRGFPNFFTQGRTRAPVVLYAYSPYWADVSAMVQAFGAHETVLIPALAVDGRTVSLSKAGLDDDAELCINALKNPDDCGTRFWHLKAYAIKLGRSHFTAVGSCNFTRAGLLGGAGNVEAMLVFEGKHDWLPDGDPLSVDDLPDEGPEEEEAPTPTPVSIVVAWDWRARRWRWWLEPGARQRAFTLHLPNTRAFTIEAGTGERRGSAPNRGASFLVKYESNGVAQSWRGRIVELNLQYSERVFGRSLSVAEILESWSSRTPEAGLSQRRGLASDEGSEEASLQHEPAAFDALNLFDFYRAIRGLRNRLRELEDQPLAQTALVVGRPNSLLTLAHLAEQTQEAPVVRYLVQQEIAQIMKALPDAIDPDLVRLPAQMVNKARQRVRQLLAQQHDVSAPVAKKMLTWFEAQLSAQDREGGAR